MIHTLTRSNFSKHVFLCSILFACFIGKHVPAQEYHLRELMGQAPASTVFVAGLADVENILTITLSAAGRTPSVMKQLEAMRKESKTHLGFDVADPSTYATAGLDLKQPLKLAFTMPEGADPRHGAFVASCGVTAPDKTWRTLQRFAAYNKLTLEHDFSSPLSVCTIESSDGMHAAASIKGRRLFLAISPAGGPAVAAKLRSFLGEADAAPLADSEIFTQTTGKQRPDDFFEVYVNLAALSPLLSEETPWLTENIASAAAGMNAGGLSLQLIFSDNAPVQKDLKPGGECRGFLSKFPRPVGAVTLSIEKPLDLAVYLIETFMGDRGYLEFETMARQRFGIEPGELGALLANGTGGIAVYLNETNPLEMPSFVQFLKINDPQRLLRMIERAYPGAVKNTVDSRTVFFEHESDESSIICVHDRYYIAGDPGLITNILKGKTQKWKPVSGGDNIISAEIFLQSVPLPLGMLLKQTFNENDRARLALTTAQNGLTLTLTSDVPLFSPTSFTGIAAGFLIPAIAKGRQRVRTATCVNNLRNLGMLMMMYANDHQLRYPDSLSALYQYIPEKELELFVCPESDAELTDPKEIEQKSSYILVKGVKASSPRMILMYERDVYHQGGVNVLFSDGSVHALPLQQLKNMLKNQGASYGGEATSQ